MKIIKDHKTDVIKKRMSKEIKDIMSNHDVKKKTCNIFTKKVEETISNKHLIDEFIDEWWIFNCPETYSVTEVNDRVYDFFHQLLLTNEQETSTKQASYIEKIKDKIEIVK
jgi:hypothetical protein